MDRNYFFLTMDFNLLYAQSLLENLIETGKCTTTANYKVFACFFVLSIKLKNKRLLSVKVKSKSRYLYMQKKTVYTNSKKFTNQKRKS